MGPEIHISEKASKKLHLNNVLNIIDCDKLDEDDIITLKERVKEIENKVREKNKPKTITISGKSHAKIKSFCKSMNLNIGEWTSDILLKEIEERSCIINDERDQDEIRDSEVEDITNRYVNEVKREKTLIKSNMLLFSRDVKFVGYSQYDGNPIYEKLGKIDFQDLKIDVDLVKQKEVSNNIQPNYNLDIKWF